MVEWRTKLDTFLLDFVHTNDIIGILVCGSYITGNPSNHSDLDVHIVLDDNVNYRERGNRIIDGFLIEYFCNPPRQIIKYFEDDIQDSSLMAQTQFATGKIICDKTGEIKSLKDKALEMIGHFYENTAIFMSERIKYDLWDMLDDLQDAYENNKPDFDFLYFNLLNRLISNYMGCINRPYHFKTILGNINSNIVREKYLLKELPHIPVNDLIERCIKAVDRAEKMEVYQCLTNEILNRFGGFDVDKFKLKSDVEV